MSISNDASSPPSRTLSPIIRNILLPPLFGLQLAPLATWALLTIGLWHSGGPVWLNVLVTVTLNVMLAALWPLLWLYWLVSFLFG